MKSLEDMTLSELWDLFPIILKDPAPEKWKKSFEREKEILQGLLGSLAETGNHVGSTAVGTIKAKDIVDILVEVIDGELKECADILKNHGYIVMSESPDRISLNKGYTPCGYADEVFHIHLRKKGDNDELYFRDYLIRHYDVAKRYEELKLSLKEKYGKDRDAYTLAKTDFVKEYTQKGKSGS